MAGILRSIEVPGADLRLDCIPLVAVGNKERHHIKRAKQLCRKHVLVMADHG